MKFFDGNWLVRKDVSPHFAWEVRDAILGPGELTLYRPDRPVVGREHTIDGGLITIRVSSPLEGVARVRVSHFEGGAARGPAFSLNEARSPEARSPEVRLEDDGESLFFATGRLVVRVHRKLPYLVEFLELDEAGKERRLTWTGERRTAWLT